MAFHEVRLPDTVERGAVFGPRFNTTIFDAASGFEQRNINWSQARSEGDISYGIASKAILFEVIEFFRVREGRAHGFRFKDWGDFEIGTPAAPASGNQQIGLGDTTTTDFQIFKRYDSSPAGAPDTLVYDRTIKKIVLDTDSVFVDAVAQTRVASGPAAGEYSIDINTGIITLGVAPADTGGSGPGGEEIVSVACEFDTPVRFDTDYLGITVPLFDKITMPEIPIKELRVK